jgi:hypothetical protein
MNTRPLKLEKDMLLKGIAEVKGVCYRDFTSLHSVTHNGTKGADRGVNADSASS